MIRLDADAVVGDRQFDPLRCRQQADLDAAALGGELDRVRQQVVEHLLQAVEVAVDHDFVRIGGETQLDPLRLRELARIGDRGIDDVDDVDALQVEIELAADDARGIEQIIDEPGLMVDVALDRLGRAPDQCRIVLARTRQDLAPALQRIERRTQLVRDDGEKLVLRAIGPLGFAAQAVLGHQQAFELLLRFFELGDVPRHADDTEDLPLRIA